MKPIAFIHTGFSEKFGIPRQSGLADTEGYIEFEPEYASRDSVRGLEEFSHIWLIWQFSENHEDDWTPTVRPPRLGGNERKGVFATRSPFRPNHIGLSCVRLERIEFVKDRPILHVTGADLMDKTPIYDIKPYVPYVDSVPDAKGSFAQQPPERIEVVFDRQAAGKVSQKTRDVLVQLLSQNPKPAYQDDEERIYGMNYDGFNVKFKVNKRQITVVDICGKCDKI